MTIIIAKDYKVFFPYSEDQLKPKWTPVRFPCLCTKESIDGGLGGDWWEIQVYYIPINIDSMTPEFAFVKGLKIKPVSIEVY